MQFRQFVKGFKLAIDTPGDDSGMILAMTPHTFFNDANALRKNGDNVVKLSQIF